MAKGIKDNVDNLPIKMICIDVRGFSVLESKG